MEFCNTCKKRNSGIMGYCCFCHNGEEYEEEVKESKELLTEAPETKVEDTSKKVFTVGEVKEEDFSAVMVNSDNITVLHVTPSRDLVQELADNLMKVEAEAKRDSDAK